MREISSIVSGTGLVTNGPWWNNVSTNWGYTNLTRIDSTSHGRFRSSDGDDGGAFYLYKNVWKLQPFENSRIGEFRPGYSGVGTTDDTNMQDLPSLPGASPWSQISAYAAGATAIARTEPTRSVFQGAQFLGELHEGLPRIPLDGTLRRRTAALRGSGDEYLNVEFGWLPLMSDLRNFARAVKHGNKIFAGYVKASDSKIRRRYVFQPTLESTSGNRSIISGALQRWCDGSYSHTFSERVWFAGAFRYHVPDGSGFADKLAHYNSEASKLLGLRLTPDVVWQLTPWSWMADWFGNFGDVIHNISALGHDALALQYGYVMRESKTQLELRNLVNGSVRTLDEKYAQRVEATPFGFGIDLSALTDTQLAILAALGLSKGGRPWTSS